MNYNIFNYTVYFTTGLLTQAHTHIHRDMYIHTYTHSCTCIFINWDIFPLLFHSPGLLQQTITSFGTYILMWYLPLLRDQSFSRVESDGGRESHRCELGWENVIMVHESNISFPLPFLVFFCYPLHTVLPFTYR